MAERTRTRQRSRGAADDSKRQEMSEALRKRTQQSYDKRLSGKFSNYFNEFPEGYEYWKCGEGKHVLDILPWMAGEQYPTRNYPDIQKGDPVYVLDVWIHRGIGPNEDNFVCPARNYNEDCPICEHQQELRNNDEATEEQVKALDPKRRSVYQVVCHDSDKDYQKGVMIFEVAYWFMERNLSELAMIPGRHGDAASWVTFASPWQDEGKSVSFKREGSGAENTQFLAHSFLDRNYDISEELLEQCLSLDDYLFVPTYEELQDAMFGRGGGDGEREEKAPVSARQAAVEEPTEGECPFGLRFGVDIDTSPNCQKCAEDIWQACGARADELADAAREEPAPTTEPEQETARPALQRRRG